MIIALIVVTALIIVGLAVHLWKGGKLDGALAVMLALFGGVLVSLGLKEMIKTIG